MRRLAFVVVRIVRAAELQAHRGAGKIKLGAQLIDQIAPVIFGGLLSAGAENNECRRARFGLGIIPSLVGWAGLLVTFAGLITVGLLIEAAGFVALTIVEGRAAHDGHVPPGYMGLRYVLSAVVIACLVSVCLVRVFGTGVG